MDIPMNHWQYTIFPHSLQAEYAAKNILQNLFSLFILQNHKNGHFAIAIFLFWFIIIEKFYVLAYIKNGKTKFTNHSSFKNC